MISWEARQARAKAEKESEDLEWKTKWWNEKMQSDAFIYGAKKAFFTV